MLLLCVPEENCWGLVKWGFYGLDVLPSTQPLVSKHWREHKALTLTGSLASSSLHPEPDSWWVLFPLLWLCNSSTSHVIVSYISDKSMHLFTTCKLAYRPLFNRVCRNNNIRWTTLNWFKTSWWWSNSSRHWLKVLWWWRVMSSSECRVWHYIVYWSVLHHALWSYRCLRLYNKVKCGNLLLEQKCQTV